MSCNVFELNLATGQEESYGQAFSSFEFFYTDNMLLPGMSLF